jgi:hypothetical protein
MLHNLERLCDHPHREISFIEVLWFWRRIDFGWRRQKLMFFL